jgi:hypothetical protein
MEAVILFTEASKNNCLAKSIYEGGYFIYRGGWKTTAYIN